MKKNKIKKINYKNNTYIQVSSKIEGKTTSSKQLRFTKIKTENQNGFSQLYEQQNEKERQWNKPIKRVLYINKVSAGRVI